MLDVTRLRVLAAVARHGSVTAAARALHYAQPSVSHHLARLEAETGSQLVERVGRGIRLTDAGRMLRAGEVDVVVLFAYPDTPPADDDGLRRTPLLAEPIYLVTPADLPGDALGDHAARRWITGCERCRAHLVRSCTDAGFNPDIAFTTDDYVAVQAIVAAGLAVTTLPGLALTAQRNPRVRIVRLPDHERLISTAVHGRALDPPATAALLTHLARAAGTAQRAPL